MGKVLFIIQPLRRGNPITHHGGNFIEHGTKILDALRNMALWALILRIEAKRIYPASLFLMHAVNIFLWNKSITKHTSIQKKIYLQSLINLSKYVQILLLKLLKRF